jgi:hypothetical protein
LNFNIFKVQTSDGERIEFFYKAMQVCSGGIVQGLRWNALDMKPLMLSAFTPEHTLLKEFNLSKRENEIFDYSYKG